MPAFHFAQIGDAHLDLLAELHRVSFAMPGSDGQEPSGDVWSRSALADILMMPGVSGEIAQSQGDPCGFFLIQVMMGSADLLTLGVRHDSRRQGCGRALLARAQGLAATQGAEQLILEVASDNQPALTLYRAMGFDQINRRRGYYRRNGGPAADAVVMKAALSP